MNHTVSQDDEQQQSGNCHRATHVSFNLLGEMAWFAVVGRELACALVGRFLIHDAPLLQLARIKGRRKDVSLVDRLVVERAIIRLMYQADC